MLITLPTVLAIFGASVFAAPNPGDGPDCQKKPERCKLTTTKGAAAPEPISTGPVLSTTTYTTSYCSIETAIPFTKNTTCLQWGRATSTVTTAYTMDNNFLGGGS
ncbi:hypothetical protein EK21DRAFT_56931 [Setomelanomma holmii]|uniref:Uncharacterized protein n=1 Tax=Setomelanomma holmii TaxID=210430 RepID=A0A9P4HH34_9PLEO|nr:hypothetical protein EK21DRAFT_56931 [Setomelanomma holmii]